MYTNQPITFADLNYDCLREIFKHLNLMEAYATIGIFNSTVDEVARDRIRSTKELYIDMRSPPEYPDELFQMIGSSIKSVFCSVGYSIESSKVLIILRPICAGAVGNFLKEVTLKYTFFRNDYIECLTPLAAQLEVLSLCNCQLNNETLNRILEVFPNLRCLELYRNFELSHDIIEMAKTKIPDVLFDDSLF